VFFEIFQWVGFNEGVFENFKPKMQDILNFEKNNVCHQKFE
jgi:hypothetical protein